MLGVLFAEGVFSYNSLIKQKRSSSEEQGNSRSTGLFDVHQEAINNCEYS